MLEQLKQKALFTYITSVAFLYLTSFLDGSQIRFIDVQDSFPKFRISSDALTTHDNIVAMCE